MFRIIIVSGQEIKICKDLRHNGMSNAMINALLQAGYYLISNSLLPMTVVNEQKQVFRYENPF